MNNLKITFATIIAIITAFMCGSNAQAQNLSMWQKYTDSTGTAITDFEGGYGIMSNNTSLKLLDFNADPVHPTLVWQTANPGILVDAKVHRKGDSVVVTYRTPDKVGAYALVKSGMSMTLLGDLHYTKPSNWVNISVKVCKANYGVSLNITGDDTLGVDYSAIGNMPFNGMNSYLVAETALSSRILLMRSTATTHYVTYIYPGGYIYQLKLRNNDSLSLIGGVSAIGISSPGIYPTEDLSVKSDSLIVMMLAYNDNTLVRKTVNMYTNWYKDDTIRRQQNVAMYGNSIRYIDDTHTLFYDKIVRHSLSGVIADSLTLSSTGRGYFYFSEKLKDNAYIYHGLETSTPGNTKIHLKTFDASMHIKDSIVLENNGYTSERWGTNLWQDSVYVVFGNQLDTNKLHTGDLPQATIWFLKVKYPAVPTGIPTLASNANIVLYPNPANNAVYITSDEKISSVKIYAIDGKLEIGKENINSTNTSVSVSELPSGIYSVLIQTPKGIVVQKLQKL